MVLTFQTPEITMVPCFKMNLEEEGGITIVDRGFRDVIRLLQNLGIVTHVPRIL